MLAPAGPKARTKQTHRKHQPRHPYYSKTHPLRGLDGLSRLPNTVDVERPLAPPGMVSVLPGVDVDVVPVVSVGGRELRQTGPREHALIISC